MTYNPFYLLCLSSFSEGHLAGSYVKASVIVLLLFFLRKGSDMRDAGSFLRYFVSFSFGLGLYMFINSWFVKVPKKEQLFLHSL